MSKPITIDGGAAYEIARGIPAVNNFNSLVVIDPDDRQRSLRITDLIDQDGPSQFLGDLGVGRLVFIPDGDDEEPSA